MPTTTKKDLIDRVADQTDEKRTVVKKVIQSFLDNVINELRCGNRLEFRDFGVFEIKQRAPRVAQNPKTLERVPVPAKKTVKFKVGRLMKLALEDAEENGVHPATERQANDPPHIVTNASVSAGAPGAATEPHPAVAGQIGLHQ